MPNNLKQKITLIGSTGLIGTHFLEEISPDDFEEVKAITRRRVPILENKEFIKQSVHDFSDLEKMRQDMKTDVLVSALGTTIKKAGSKDEFMKIDHDLTLEICSAGRASVLFPNNKLGLRIWNSSNPISSSDSSNRPFTRL